MAQEGKRSGPLAIKETASKLVFELLAEYRRCQRTVSEIRPPEACLIAKLCFKIIRRQRENF